MQAFSAGDILMLAVGVLFIYGIVKIGKATGRSIGKKVKCTRCGRYGMEPSGGRYYRNGKAGSDWKCPYCGNWFFRG